jgi:AraC family transcriptional regulator
MDVTLKDMPELRVATVRHIGPYDQIPQAFERLGALAGAAGLLERPDKMMLAIYHDDPASVPPDQLRSDAAITVPEGVALPAGLSEQRIPAGRYATTLHIGPYERLGDTWARFKTEGLPASGHRFSHGASYEVYWNTPMNTPKEQLRTELFMPVAETQAEQTFTRAR